MSRKIEFTPDEKEWVATLVNVFSTILGLKVKPIIIWDRKHFTKLAFKGKFRASQVYAECIKETGHIWINQNPKEPTKIELINTIIHELTHMKHPEWSESKVIKFTNKLAFHLDDFDSKKKAKDNIVKPKQV